jgi:hypothetical protein
MSGGNYSLSLVEVFFQLSADDKERGVNTFPVQVSRVVAELRQW